MRLKLSLLVIVGTWSFIHLNAQTKYIDKSGEIMFEASEEAFEPVKATNKSVTAILVVETGQIASLALIKGFHFKNSLMQEHFNENYVESEIYPKATFNGTLINFDHSQISENPTQVDVDGKLKLREKEKGINTTFSIQKVDGTIIMKGSFTVAPSDFDIKIPKIVANKIAKQVIVNVVFKLRQK